MREKLDGFLERGNENETNNNERASEKKKQASNLSFNLFVFFILACLYLGGASTLCPFLVFFAVDVLVLSNDVSSLRQTTPHLWVDDVSVWHFI